MLESRSAKQIAGVVETNARAAAPFLQNADIGKGQAADRLAADHGRGAYFRHRRQRRQTIEAAARGDACPAAMRLRQRRLKLFLIRQGFGATARMVASPLRHAGGQPRSGREFAHC